MAQGPATIGGCRQKQLLRPWLVEQIESGSIPGLRWVDKESSIFRMTWKRVNTEGWTPADSQLLMEWAKHKDRYSSGREDYSKWKTQLRCAFNKSNIVELKDQSRTRSATPFKVFHMAPLSRNARHHQESDVTSTTGSSDANSPSPLATYEHYSPRSNQSNANIPCAQAVNAIPGDIPLAVEQMSCSSTEETEDISVRDLNIIGDADIQAMLYEESPPLDFTEEDFNSVLKSVVDDSIFLQMQYRGLTVFEESIKNQRGFRLSYPGNRCISDEGVFEQIYGPSTLEDIMFPFLDGFFIDDQKRQDTLTILQRTDRGLQLESNDQGIFATRRCRLSVFFASSLTNGRPQKLPRKQRVKIFDRIQFMEELIRYTDVGCQGQKPNILVRLGFGQELSLFQNTKHTYVAVNVISQAAFTSLATCLQNSPTPEQAVVDDGHISQSLSAHMSNETDTDICLRKFQELSLRKK